MKTISTFVPVCLCVGLALALACLSHAVELQTEIVSPGEINFQPATEEPALAAAKEAPNVWVEAIFVELDRDVMRRLEETIGFKLSPPAGKAILTAEEKEKLLAAVDESDRARIIASSTVLTISGNQAQSEDCEEITYATEYELKEPGIEPGNWEKRDVGTILNVTPTVVENGRIFLVLMPQVTVLTGWKRIDGTDVTQPVFRSWSKTTTVIIPDGRSFVLKESAVAPLQRSQVVAPEAPPPPPRPFQPEEIKHAPITRKSAGTRFVPQLREAGPMGPPPVLGVQEVKPPPAIEKPSPHRQAILKKLESIIPQVKLEDADLKQVIELLSREADVNIVIDPVVFTAHQPPAPGAVTPVIPPKAREGITVNLKNVPVKEVLKYVLSFRNLKYVVEDMAVVVVPVDYAPPESLETEIFWFPELRGAEPVAGETIEDFLRESGIPWPKGSSIRYVPERGTLIVTNTPTNMVLVRELVPLWGPPLPPEKRPGEQKTLLTIISAKIVGEK